MIGTKKLLKQMGAILRDRQFVFKTLILILSMNLTSIALNLFVYARLGSDPITMFMEGAHLTFHVSLGTVSIVYSTVLLIVAFFTSREHLGWMTIISVFFTGPIIDIYSKVIPYENLSMFTRIAYVLFGQILFGTSYALLIEYGSGKNLIDAIIYKVMELTEINYRILRTLTEFTFLIVGILLGSKLGLASLFAVVTTRVFTDAILKIIRRKNIKNREIKEKVY